MRIHIRPTDWFGIVGAVGLTVSAVGIQDCVLSWLAGFSLHAVYTTIAARSPQTPRNT
jgi:hypothetical protein